MSATFRGPTGERCATRWCGSGGRSLGKRRRAISMSTVGSPGGAIAKCSRTSRCSLRCWRGSSAPRVTKRPSSTPRRTSRARATLPSSVDAATREAAAAGRIDFATAAEEAIAVLETADLTATVTTLQGPILLVDYLVTRCVEAVVHGADLVPPVEPDADAQRIAADALLRLLETRRHARLRSAIDAAGRVDRDRHRPRSRARALRTRPPAHGLRERRTSATRAASLPTTRRVRSLRARGRAAADNGGGRHVQSESHRGCRGDRHAHSRRRWTGHRGARHWWVLPDGFGRRAGRRDRVRAQPVVRAPTRSDRSRGVTSTPR